MISLFMEVFYHISLCGVYPDWEVGGKDNQLLLGQILLNTYSES